VGQEDSRLRAPGAPARRQKERAHEDTSSPEPPFATSDPLAADRVFFQQSDVSKNDVRRHSFITYKLGYGCRSKERLPPARALLPSMSFLVISSLYVVKRARFR